MDALATIRASHAGAIAAAGAAYTAAPQPHAAWDGYVAAVMAADAAYGQAVAAYGSTIPMPTVWLYCELTPDGQVTDGTPDGQVLTIEDHLAEVPQGAFANDLLRQVVYHRTDAIGRLLPPTYAWRLATDGEVQALLAKRTGATTAATADPITPPAGKSKSTTLTE